MEKINKIVANFQNDEEFKRWGIRLEMNMPKVSGEKLEPPKLHNGRSFDDFKNRKVPHLAPLRLRPE
jgi:hypothetical protein